MTLTLKIVNQFFCMTHHLMIIHYQAKFGKKWLSGSGVQEILSRLNQTYGQMDKVIPIQPPPIYMGVEKSEGDRFTLTFALSVQTPLVPVEIQPF